MLRLSIPLQPCSKARPRVTRSGHAYMPKPYQDWRREFVRLVKKQWDGEAIVGDLAVRMEFYHKGKSRGDLDNLAGAVADALQDAGVYPNDKAIKRAVLRTIENTGESPRIEVALRPLNDLFHLPSV